MHQYNPAFRDVLDERGTSSYSYLREHLDTVGHQILALFQGQQQDLELGHRLCELRLHKFKFLRPSSKSINERIERTCGGAE